LHRSKDARSDLGKVGGPKPAKPLDVCKVHDTQANAASFEQGPFI
jgi:hypothetical protein